MHLTTIYLIVTILSLLGSILAWIAKLKWAQEFANAKNAIIESKEAQMQLLFEQIKTKDQLLVIKDTHIEHLNNLTPTKLHEYYTVTKQDLGAYIDMLKSELDATKLELNSLLNALNKLDTNEPRTREVISSITQEKVKLERRLGSFMDTFKDGLIDLFKEEEEKIL